MRRLHGASFYILLSMVIFVAGCSSLTYKDIMPQQPVIASQTKPQFDGTVEVHSIIKPERMGYDLAYDLPLYVDAATLETALKESVANSGLFAKVVQKNADYVLDVWVDGVESFQPPTGIGDYGAKVSSIWRVTRGRDGKVLVCDFVDGSGLINTMVSAPRTKSLAAALKNMIQNGLQDLADTSSGHLSAKNVAGIRPSMGAAVPEGLRAWEDKVKKNWSNLRKGLSMEEVENIIGPVKTSGALERIYLKFKTWYHTHDSYSYDDGKARVTSRGHLYIALDSKSLTYYDKDMGAALTLFSPRSKIFPHYEEHSYICYKNPPNTGSILGKESVYCMTHMYVLKFYPFEGLQTWVLR